MSTRRRLMMQGGGGGGEEYIQDGLVFCVDANSFDGSSLVDTIGGYVYNLVGNATKLSNGMIQIAARSMFQCVGSDLSFPTNTHTLEIAFRNHGAFGNWIRVFNPHGANGTLQFIIKYNGLLLRSVYDANAMTITYTSDGFVQFQTISISNTLCVKNLQEVPIKKTGDYTNAGSGNYIGDSSNNFTLDIGCIRVYNRQLTKDEREHNQMIDISRFN